MTLHISLNGKDIKEYGITHTDGIINTLVKPADYKKVITNGVRKINYYAYMAKAGGEAVRNGSSYTIVPRSSAGYTVRPASTEWVSHTLPPMVQWSPMRVFPPRIVAPA